MLGSPFKYYKILPGILDFTKSDIQENNVNSTYLTSINPIKWPRCYVGDYCDIEVFLRDSFLNFLDQELGIIKKMQVNIIALGPFDNIDGRQSTQYYFNNLTQFFPDRPEKYYFSFGFNYVGKYKLYARYKDSDGQIQYAKFYPVEVNTYSDIPSHKTCDVQPTFSYVGSTLVTVVAKDKFNNTLTDYGVKMRCYLEFDRYSDENDTASSPGAISVPPPNQNYLVWDIY